MFLDVTPYINFISISSWSKKLIVCDSNKLLKGSGIQTLFTFTLDNTAALGVIDLIFLNFCSTLSFSTNVQNVSKSWLALSDISEQYHFSFSLSKSIKDNGAGSEWGLLLFHSHNLLVAAT